MDWRATGKHSSFESSRFKMIQKMSSLPDCISILAGPSEFCKFHTVDSQCFWGQDISGGTQVKELMEYIQYM